jgi:hypothetical protein
MKSPDHSVPKQEIFENPVSPAVLRTAFSSPSELAGALPAKTREAPQT